MYREGVYNVNNSNDTRIELYATRCDAGYASRKNYSASGAEFNESSRRRLNRHRRCYWMEASCHRARQYTRNSANVWLFYSRRTSTFISRSREVVYKNNDGPLSKLPVKIRYTPLVLEGTGRASTGLHYRRVYSL